MPSFPCPVGGATRVKGLICHKGLLQTPLCAFNPLGGSRWMFLHFLGLEKVGHRLAELPGKLHDFQFPGEAKVLHPWVA